MIKITVAIITLNEERNIGRCITSVKDIADEILVVDSFSTDNTESIATSLGARVVKNHFLGYQDQKNLAASLATNDYILSLDADEELTAELASSIKLIKNSTTQHRAYTFNRLTNYCGKWIYHCGWNPDIKIRLYDRNYAKWGGGNIHEKVVYDGAAEFLNGNLLHYSYPTISSHINQTNKFSTLSAKHLFSINKRSSIFKIYTRPILKFFRDYFIKLGILDGRYGFIICFINALSALLKYSKLYDLQNGKEI